MFSLLSVPTSCYDTATMKVQIFKHFYNVYRLMLYFHRIISLIVLDLLFLLLSNRWHYKPFVSGMDVIKTKLIIIKSLKFHS